MQTLQKHMVRNWLEATENPRLDPEKKPHLQPSLTVPDQSYSVAEIMKRWASGLSTGGQRVAIYDGEEYLPDMSKMDLADRETFMESIRDEISETKAKAVVESKKKKQASQKPKDDQEIPYQELPPKGEPGQPGDKSTKIP